MSGFSQSYLSKTYKLKPFLLRIPLLKKITFLISSTCPVSFIFKFLYPSVPQLSGVQRVKTEINIFYQIFF